MGGPQAPRRSLTTEYPFVKYISSDVQKHKLTEMWRKLEKLQNDVLAHATNFEMEALLLHKIFPARHANAGKGIAQPHIYGKITTQKPEPLIYQGFRLFLLLTCYKFNIKPGQIKTNL